jgi:hypothetical protein
MIAVTEVEKAGPPDGLTEAGTRLMTDISTADRISGCIDILFGDTIIQALAHDGRLGAFCRKTTGYT